MSSMLGSIVRPAVRALSARPGLSATVVGSLSLGLAVTAIAFGVLDAAVLRPFPFPEPDRLVGIGSAYPRLNRPLGFFEAMSAPEYLDVRDGARTLDRVLAFDLNNEAIVFGDRPERVFTAFVWADPLTTLGINAAIGRGFTREEIEGGAAVAIVSDSLWRNVLGADTGVIGRQVRWNGRPVEIVGIAPPRTRIYGTDVWMPMGDRPATLPRDRRQFNVMARIVPGTPLEMVQRELEQIARRIELAHGPGFPEYERFQLGARPWTEIDGWGYAGVNVIALAALALLVVLIGANLAGLLLARAGARRHESAVHLALGAGRGRIVSNLLAEAAVQGLSAAALAVGLTWVGLRLLPVVMPAGILPGEAALGLSPRLVGGVVAGALALTALIGLVPAWQLARVKPADVLNAGASRAIGSRTTRRLHEWVVGVELAAATAVTAAAMLLAVHTGRVLRVDRGFDTSGLIVTRVTLPVAKYDGERSLAFFDAALERVRALPAVAAASASNQPPPGVFSRSQFEIAGQTTASAQTLPSAFYTTAASGYRETLGLRLEQGRWFDETAPDTGPREVVVNRTAADRFFPTAGAVGQRIRIVGPANDGSFAEIVGVVSDVRNAGLVANPAPEIIGSVRQIPARRRTQLYLAIRSTGDPGAVVGDVRQIVQSLDPDQPIYAISTVEEQYEGGIAARRGAAWLLAAFCGVAIALAGLGVFGVLTYAAADRAREIGLRVALGGRRSSIVRLMLAQAARPLVAGIGVGALAVVLGERYLAAWLFGVQPNPIVLALTVLALFAIGILAGLVPSLRASRLSPLDALRQ
jgi:predicted permease